MKNPITKLAVFFTALVLILSCSNDNAVMQPPSVTVETAAEQNARIEALISSTTITGDLIVTTVDEFGNYLPDVNITIDGSTHSSGTISNAIIEDVVMNDNYVFITAEKSGYEKVMRTITPSKNGLTNVELMLITDVPSKTLAATTGGTVTLGNTILNFPANAIVDVSGNPYTGSVDINMVYYDPTATNFAQTQPGTLVGVTETDEIKALVSEGMLTVDLTDGSGNPLNIADNKTVKIIMPASASGPATISFWHLNETHGIWVEQGEATKVGNTYEYEVSHFSTYNLDWFENPIANGFCVKLKDQNGNILANQNVEILLGNGSTIYVTTDNVGEVCFYGASQGNYTFKVETGCGSVLSSINITSSGSHDVIFDFGSNSIPIISFSGLLYTCNNQLAINTPFILSIDDYQGTIYNLQGISDQNGAYSFNEPMCLSIGTTLYPASVIVNKPSSFPHAGYPDVITNVFSINLFSSSVDLNSCEEADFIANTSAPINFNDSKFCSLAEFSILNGLNFNDFLICNYYVTSYDAFIPYDFSILDFNSDPNNDDGFGNPIVEILNGEISDISGIKFLGVNSFIMPNQNISDISELGLYGTSSGGFGTIDLTGNPIDPAHITWLRQKLANHTILF